MKIRTALQSFRQQPDPPDRVFHGFKNGGVVLFQDIIQILDPNHIERQTTRHERSDEELGG